MKYNRIPIKNFPNYFVEEDKILSTKSGKLIELKQQTINKYGHKQVILHKNGKKFSKKVHRLIAYAYLGECPIGMECRHRDGNPSNNHPTNLLYGNHAENMSDMIKHGNSLKGMKNPASKLTEKDVLFIKTNKNNISQRKLAVIFGVSKSAIAAIHSGRNWTYLNE